MKVNRILLVCGLAALPQFVMAAEMGERPRAVEGKHQANGTAAHASKPAASAGHESKESDRGPQKITSPEGLGIVHAMLDFCAKVDPHDAAAFQTIWLDVSGGASVAGSDYQQGYTLISTELGQMSNKSAAQTCAVAAKTTLASDRRTSGVGKRPE